MSRSRKIGLFCFVIPALVLAVVHGAQAAPPMVGKLIFLQGQVVVRRAGAADWQGAQLNQEIFAGDAVQTGPSSRAAILCVDESQIKLNENTILVLKSVAPSPRLRSWAVTPAEVEPTPSSKYEIIRGEIWLRNKNEKFHFELEAPAVSATIRGTELNIRVAPDGSTSVILLEGGVCLTNPQGEMCLRPGEEGLVLPGRAPTKRALVTPQDAVQWSLYYPDIFSYRDLPLTPPPETVRASAGPPALAARIQQAEAAYDQGKLGEAKELADAVLKQDPQSPRALTLLGWVSLQQHTPAEARDYFLKVRPADEMTVIGLALARYNLGEVGAAYQLLKEARQKLRPTPVLLTMTGFLAMVAGEVKEATPLLEAASRQAPTYALPRALLAQIYLVQNRKDAAIAEASQALASAPGSPMALLAMGLVKMSYFDLPAATQYLEKAIAADPRFIDAYHYLAKIQLGSEYLGRARKTVDAALKLAPWDADVLSLAGFVRLAYRDFNGAKKLWEQAVKANPGLGEPHLGLAIYQFKERNYDQGVAEMLTATLLEPRVALYQTELGKALYQVRNFDKALEVYDYAKSLDPKDPTPYFYKGIALSNLNRPGEAIQEINKSVELNDNVAMFRSRSLLDRDMAVRNYSLARAYQQLGLTDWGLSKAVTAVKYQPFDSSAHLFLRDIISGARAGSEAPFLTAGLLFSTAAQEGALYRILSPANQATFSSLQFVGTESLGLTHDYAPMFEMPYARLGVMGGIGASEGSKSIQDHQYYAYGGWPGAAFETFGFYQDDRGVSRPPGATLQSFSGTNNAYGVEAAVKWEPTVQGVFTGFYQYQGVKMTDSLTVPTAWETDICNVRTRLYELAYYHRFSPQAAFLVYAAHKDYPYHIASQYFDFPNLYLLRQNFDQEFNNIQLQQHLTLSLLGEHNLVAGLDYFSSIISQRFRIDQVGNGTLYQFDYRPPFWSHSFYLQDYWRLSRNLVLELALWKDFQKDPRSAPLWNIFPGTIYTSLWSPRFGANYQFGVGNTQHTLRAVLERHLTTHLISQPLLVPSEIASFPWVIDATSGSEMRQAGAAWEAQWDSKTFTTLRLNALRVSTPTFDLVSLNRISQTWKRYQASLALNRILTDSLGLSLGVMGKRVVPDFSLGQDFSEIDAFLGLAYMNRQGWLARIRPLLMQQFGKIPGHQADNPFVIMNLTLGREFPNKWGFALFEIQNLFNRQPFYSLEPNRDLDFPMKRRFLFRLALYF